MYTSVLARKIIIKERWWFDIKASLCMCVVLIHSSNHFVCKELCSTALPLFSENTGSVLVLICHVLFSYSIMKFETDKFEVLFLTVFL